MFGESSIKRKSKISQFLWQINIALSVDYDSGYSKATEKEYQDLYKKVFGIDITELKKKLKEAKLKYVYTIDLYSGPVLKILDMLFKEYYEENKDYLFEIGKVCINSALENIEIKDTIKKREEYNNDPYYSVSIYNRYSGVQYLFAKAIDYLEFYNDEKAFIESFVLRYILDKKIEKYINENLKGCEILGVTKILGLRNYAIAISLKIADKDLMYKEILEIDNRTEYEKRMIFSNLDTYMNDYRSILAKKENRKTSYS